MTNETRIIDGVERRREARFALKVAASLRLPGKPRAPARVLDLSRDGCRITTQTPLARGTAFWLTIANLPPLYCHAMWAHERFVGVRFAVPIDVDVLRALTDTFGNLSENDIRELRALSQQCTRLAQADAAHPLTQLADDCDAEAEAFDTRRQNERIEALLSRLSTPPPSPTPSGSA